MNFLIDNRKNNQTNTETKVNLKHSGQLTTLSQERINQKRCKTSPKSTVKTPEQHKWHHYDVSTASQKDITQLAPVPPLPWTGKWQNKWEQVRWKTITTYLNETKYKKFKIA